jgi:hypothetical protein
MPLSWTVHIPQAMQRHGGSVRPSEQPDCEEAMAGLFRSIRRQDAQKSPSEPKTRAQPTAGTSPGARPSSP